MAHARYDRNCDWYIFWYSTRKDGEREARGNRKPRDDETLAIWHGDHRAQGPLFTYAEVCEMLRTVDFSRIPGFAEIDRDLISECLSEFVRDVDEEHG